MKLIDKLNKHKETISVLRGTEKQGSHEFNFLGHHLLGVQTAIDIVKQYKCTWKGTFSKAEETIYYTLSCGNKYLDDCLGADVECFKYCPYCGGEIEFSEV